MEQNDNDSAPKENTTKTSVTSAFPTPAPFNPTKVDGYGRNVSDWIEVNGKLRPHP